MLRVCGCLADISLTDPKTFKIGIRAITSVSLSYTIYCTT